MDRARQRENGAYKKAVRLAEDVESVDELFADPVESNGDGQ